MVAFNFGTEFTYLIYMDLNAIKQTRDALSVTHVNRRNIIQINVSINIYKDITSTAICIHIGLFVFHPLYTVNETKYKLYMYLHVSTVG